MMRTSAVAAFLVIIVLAAAAPAAAQVPVPQPPAGQIPAGPGRIGGVVTDSVGRPIATAAITVRSAADSAIVTGVMTDASGRFRVEGLPLGRYLLRVSFVGYKPRNSEEISLTAAAPALDLGEIALEGSAIALDAVVAEAERAAVVIEADRTVYNTQSMPVASTGNATDVLRAVPELEVDVDNNVKLRGNQAVAIHLNGRPAPLRGEQLANFLQQLPGNRIARVEVMPNPSAKHDPEGMGGIVNIVLKDDLDLGLSGSLSANASTRNRRYFNGRLNYQKGRLTLFTGAGISTYQNEGSNYDLRQNLVTDPVTMVEQSGASDNRSFGWNLDWTAELKAGERATLWSNAWMYTSGNDSDQLVEYGILDENRVVMDRYDRDNENEFTWGSYNFGFGFKQVFEPQKEELTIDGRHSSGVNDTEGLSARLFHVIAGQSVDRPLEVTLNEIDAGNGNLSVQADYFRPLGGAKLELGYRAWQRTQDNDNLLQLFAAESDPAPSAETRGGYDYEELFHSLYATYGRTFGRFGMQLGVRAELANTMFDSHITDDSFERSYNSLFPSINFSYTLKPGRTVRALYSRRISRPSPYYLDPAVPATDPLNVFVGNPDLRPSYTDSYSFDFSWMGSLGTVRVAPYYRYATDVWERIRTVDSNGVATSRWENATSSKAYGSSFTISLRPAGRISGSTSFSVYRDVRDGTNISSQYRRAAWMWSLGGNVAAKITGSLTGQAFANHFPQQSILQGRASGYTFTSVSLRQQLFGTKGTISLSVSDPLNLYRYDSHTRDATYIQTSRSSYQSRVFTLGLTYNFGKPPQQQSRRSGPEEQGETIRVR
ncbi:MAG TPA: outer membrane beta-barrel family protein [Longimicrobiales bacterium]